MLTFEAVGAILGAVVDQKVARVEVFVVSQYKPLVSGRAEMLLHP